MSTHEPCFTASDVTIWNADARDAHTWLPEASVDAIVTSPPYFGLRDYGTNGQLGMEDTPGEYVEGLADLLTGYARVLKPGGSLWLNLGDTYGGGAGPPHTNTGSRKATGSGTHGFSGQGHVSKPPTDVPAKCLLMVPERVALALIGRGWLLRNKVVWAKSNGMPSSVTDRLATKWEYLFHLVREPRYFYDLDAIREPATTHASGTANPGDVWTIPTQPYADAHFAVFPSELVRRPVLATVPMQVCRRCGAVRQRLTEAGDLVPTRPGTAISTTGQAGRRAGDQSALRARNFATGGGNSMPRRERHHVGWSDCGCAAGWQPGLVLDPFFGAGTTAVMARRLGRRTWGVELNPDYCALAAKRLSQDVLTFDPA